MTWHTVLVDFHDGSQDLDLQTQFSQDLYPKASPGRKGVCQSHFLAWPSHWRFFLLLFENNEKIISFNFVSINFYTSVSSLERPFSITTNSSSFKCELLLQTTILLCCVGSNYLAGQQIWFALGKGYYTYKISQFVLYPNHQKPSFELWTRGICCSENQCIQYQNISKS